MRCPSCNLDVVGAEASFSILDTRTCGETIPETLFVIMKTRFWCGCGTSVTTQEVLNYKLDKQKDHVLNVALK